MTEKVAYKNVGKEGSETLQGYLNSGGYQVWRRLVQNGTPSEVIEAVRQSGLRGCGGAGFPTGNKWLFVVQATGTPKYVICNADEGEPGTFKDRAIMEEDPHLLIEGMAIAGFAVGAQTGYIYLRGEYALAYQRLTRALKEAGDSNLIGDNILGSQVNCHINVVRGAGAYICGEEIALIESLEGKRGTPRVRPPYPPSYGVWGKPTLVNNVETLARVPTILERGAEWYRKLGIGGSPGTKVYCISGHINKAGAYELAMGTPAKELIYKYGGGMRANRNLKGFFPGGVSSAVLPASMADLPMDYEPLNRAGSMLGSGAMIVMDDSACMVEVARETSRFFVHESCGKCTPCRVGTRRMLEILERISAGEGTQTDIELLLELSDGMRETSLCGLGQAAPNPVLSTLKYFRDDYDAHIKEHRCPVSRKPAGARDVT